MNIVAILVSALVCFIVGFLFHGPFLGKTWMKLAGITPTGNEKLKDMWKQMVWNYLANVLMAIVLSGVFWIAFTSPLMGDRTWFRGAIIAAWLWLGFIVASSSMDVIWMGRSYKLWLFEVVASLVAIMSMGAVLAVWQ